LRKVCGRLCRKAECLGGCSFSDRANCLSFEGRSYSKLALCSFTYSLGWRETSRVKVEVEVEVPEGDDEGVYKEEFRHKLAKRILNILLDRETEPAREAVEEVLREKEKA
jgi:hypothetical protein